MSILLATPLAILPARFQTYDTTPKLAVLFVAGAVLLWLSRYWWPGMRSLWRTRAGQAFYSLIILNTASLFISSVFSNDAWLSFGGTVWRRLGAIDQIVVLFIAAVLAARVPMDRKMTRTAMLAMETAGAIASVYAILQYAGWDPLIPANIYTLGSPPAVRPPATLSQATVFATFLLAPIPIAAWFRLHEGSSRWKRAHELVLLLTVAALILSGTRSALIGLGAAVCVLLYVERDRVVQRKIVMRAFLGVLVFAAAAALFVALPAGKGVRARFAQWAGDRAGGPRLLVWRDSLPFLWQHPVAGLGPEQFEQAFRKIESLELARAYPDHYHESPHNFVLEAAIGQGLTGLVAWLGLLGIACWCGFRCIGQGNSEAAPILAGLLAMVISLQFSPLTITTELYLLVLCAILVGFAARDVPAQSYRVVLSPVAIWSARTVSAALVGIAAAYVAQTALYALAESRAFHRDLAGAAGLYDAARRFPMPGPNLELSKQCTLVAQHSASLVRQRAFALGIEAAEWAEQGSAERFNALYQSALLAIVTRNLSRAESKLRAAIDCAPAWYRPKVALASVLWWQGRDQEAQREAALALQCAGREKMNAKHTLDGARAHAAVMAARRSP